MSEMKDVRSRGAGSQTNRSAGPGVRRPAYVGERSAGRTPSIRLLITGGSLCLAAVAFAGAAPPPRPQVEARLIAPATLAAGTTGAVVVEMTIGPGWHVNSHKPLQSFLIPTTATLTASAGALSEITYPEPVRRRFAFADEELAVYEGTVRFESQLSLPKPATGSVALDGVLSYQACNDSQCYPPAKVALKASVAVGGTPAKGKRP
jgi:DsbC/DsbD-like thiol-disulfide interchange protein